MKNRKLSFSFAVCAAALLCALGAWAETVDRPMAVYAARRWATSGAVLERPLGQTVVSSETLTATNDVTLHVVRFDGGTAFVSSDTELEPIVAFTTSTNFTADADNKLWQLLKRDTIVRHNMLSLSRKTSAALALAAVSAHATSAAFPRMASTTAAAQGTSTTNAATGKWAKLLEGRSSGISRAFGASPPNQLTGVSDVRVAPLVKSRWSQTTDEQYPSPHYCYNLYTPNHAPCGCTATAMSQIMRYYAYPTNDVTARTFSCEVDGESVSLTMKGGKYDWDKMTLYPPTSSYAAENWEAIGKLTSDVGISIKTSYVSPSSLSSGSGSSYVSLVSGALKNVFGYANGACIFNFDIAEEAYGGDGRVHSNQGLHNLTVREKVIYANLDAKCPVELGIYGYADEQIGTKYNWEGHAVVGDGYGYSEYAGEQVPYVHINLGWHGLDDAWYNIPEVHSPNSGSYVGSDGTAFTVLSAAAYNLFPTNTGNIVSGRVVDGEDAPIAGATMTIRVAGTSEIIASCATDAKGIYAFIVPGDVCYDITCDDTARGLSDTHTVTVPKNSMEVTDTYGTYTEKDDCVGNYWGNDADFEMSEPSVRNERTSVEYLSLNAALATVGENDTLSVIRSTRLKASVSVQASCKVVLDPIESGRTPLVRCEKGAVLTIPSNVSVRFEGVAFTNTLAGLAIEGAFETDLGTKFDSFASLTVAANGSASLTQTTVFKDAVDWSVSGTLRLGSVLLASNQTVTVASTGGLTLTEGVTNLVKVTLEDATKESLTLAGVLAGQLAVDAPTAHAQDDVFGQFATIDYATASETAKRIYNVYDPDLGGMAVSASGELKWGVVDVPIADAFCVVETEDGQLGYRSFAAALKALGGKSGSITIKEDLSFTNTVTLAQTLTLVATNDATLSFTAEAGFVIPAGANLILTNVTVSGEGVSSRDCAFRVAGGGLTLEKGATVTDFSDESSRKDINSPWGGTVVAMGGSVTMKSGSLITNCISHCQGGAIWLNSTNATANLLGGTIADCTARNSEGGGAVYGGFLGAKVNVAGDFTATDNTMGPSSSATTGNLYLSRLTVLTLTGTLTGAVGVSFGDKNGYSKLNVLKANFIALGSGVTEAQAILSADGFCHDANETFVGHYDMESSSIVWAEVEDDDDGRCPEEYAKYAGVRVTVEGVNGYRYYWCIDDAFEYVKTNATFEVKGTVYDYYLDGITKDVTIDHDVRITSWAGHPYHGSDIMILWRTYHAMYKVAKGGSLTLSNVKLVGACSWDSGYDPWDDDAEHAFTPLFYSEIPGMNPTNRPPKGVGLISVDGGSLTLEDGARVGYVHGNASRASNAITVFNGGTVTMESGSRVTEVYNEYQDDYEVSCGGGILLDRSTGYFEGGLIYNCKAYRAGGLYVANESTAYVSGDIYIGCNYAYKDDNEDNIVVSKNSNLVLTGPLSCMDPEGSDGYIGVNEGIAGDTSCFATVDWEWTDFDELTASAEYFVHDRRGGGYVCGVPVTNWNAETHHWDTRLVWDDSLSPANGITIDGKTYRGAIQSGLTVAVPKAFSVTPTATANGKMSLALEGAEEGCWYTVYSTEDLAQPFKAETSIHLKPGETFSYEIDHSAGSKFYKVIAEEGLK